MPSSTFLRIITDCVSVLLIVLNLSKQKHFFIFFFIDDGSENSYISQITEHILIFLVDAQEIVLEECLNSTSRNIVLLNDLYTCGRLKNLLARIPLKKNVDENISPKLEVTYSVFFRSLALFQIKKNDQEKKIETFKNWMQHTSVER